MNLKELRDIPYFDKAPERVISLIPSMTENLFLLGFGSFVIGITDYCIHPMENLRGIPRLGGPKNPDFEKIIELSPDLVILNQEESSPEVVHRLNLAGIKMWLTFPKNIDQAMDTLYDILGIFKNDKAVIQLKSLQTTLDFVRLSTIETKKIRYFCPIWLDKIDEFDWMMTFNHDTYPSDLLNICGGENVFSTRERSYPLRADLGLGETEQVKNRDTRYPRVSLNEIVDKNPELILLPSEPFEFINSHLEVIKQLLADTEAVKNDKVLMLDGTLLFWPGVRMGKALRALPEILIPEW